MKQFTEAIDSCNFERGKLYIIEMPPKTWESITMLRAANNIKKSRNRFVVDAKAAGFDIFVNSVQHVVVFLTENGEIESYEAITKSFSMPETVGQYDNIHTTDITIKSCNYARKLELTPEMMRNTIAEDGLDICAIIVDRIDHVHLIGEENIEKPSRVVRAIKALKELAVEYNVPVITSRMKCRPDVGNMARYYSAEDIAALQTIEVTIK